MKNRDGRNKGVKTIAVDGVISTRNIINLVNDQAAHQVEVLMGE